MPVMGRIDRRLATALVVLVVVIAVMLALTALHDSVNQALAWLQGCPHYIPQSFAPNAGCPFNVHPWLVP